MSVRASHIKRVIATGVFKVLYHRNLRWSTIRDQPMTLLFDSVANPTTWPTFFTEAVASAIQQELVLRGSYCPELEKELVEMEKQGKKWSELEEFIKANVRNTQVNF